MSWGINPNATEKEKIFAEFNDSINGLNCADGLSYRHYSAIYDLGRKLADDEYNQGRADERAKVRAEVIEFISDKLIYPLLNEYDRGLWEHIDYIELAEEWIKVLDDNPYPKVKNHTEARKRDLRQWIAEQLKEQKNE